MFKFEKYVKSGKSFPCSPQFVENEKCIVLSLLDIDYSLQMFSDPPLNRKATRKENNGIAIITFESDYTKTVYTVPNIY